MRISIIVVAFFAALFSTSNAIAAQCVDNLKSQRGVLDDIINCLKVIDKENSALRSTILTLQSRKPIEGMKGEPGEKGLQGRKGETGEQGVNGQDGRNGSNAKIPSGAVVAFDFDIKISSGCPKGWNFFEPAGGRVIVGAGDHQNKWFRSETGEVVSITIYPTYVQDIRAGFSETASSRATGGEERVTLTVAEMPSHSHDLPVNSDPSAQGLKWQNGYNKKTGMSTSEAGDSQPHNNMPPYISLYYCKKN